MTYLCRKIIITINNMCVKSTIKIKKMGNPEIAKKGPYVMDMEAGTKYWCSCGKSSNQPFCDGSHKGTEFVPSKVEIAKASKVAWCGCKQSKNGAFCDGSHAKL